MRYKGFRLMIHWPTSWIAFIQKVKSIFGFFKHHFLLGMPLDLPFRFVLLGGVYLLLQRKLTRGKSAVLCIVLLLSKEIFDLFAVQQFSWPKSPNWGDMADVISGLAGIGMAEVILRCRARWFPRKPV